jgi:N-acyl-D-aspartate/D-glutamate deacylase
MAFYNSGLCLLRHVHQSAEAGAEFMTFEHAVHRLTGELADWYSLDAGHLRVGDRADIAVIDPAHLDASLSAYAEESVEQYDGLSRMVNRNDDTVTAVLVGGRTVFRKGVSTDIVGKIRTGSFLRAGRKISAPAQPVVAIGG